MLTAACFTTTTVLLWLGAEVGAQAAGRTGRQALAVSAAAVALLACALWWPAHLLPAEGTLVAAPGAVALLAFLPGLTLGALGLVTAERCAARAWLAALVAGLATLAAAYALAMLTAPGIFRLVPGERLLGGGAAIVVLAGAMIGLHLRLTHAVVARGIRIAAALAAAGMLTLALALTVSPGGVVAAPHWTELGKLVALVGLAAVLLAVLRQGPAAADVVARPVRSATTDGLTGLPTRLFFEERLATAAKRCHARKTKLAVLFIDLDGFKPVNDTRGHGVGDRVLEQVGLRLRSLTRGADIAARIGGDEFLLLLPDIGALEAVAQVAKRLIETLGQPYKVDDRAINISCSVGIATYPDGCDVSQLTTRADLAMYAAKRSGGSRHCFYSAEMHNDVQSNSDMERDLREALTKNELELYFQPKIDARSGKITAAEALLRWKHPTRGLVMPGQFIPLAERTGLIGPLGNWVIEAACKQARAWRDKGLRMRVAINVSPLQMRQDDIVDRIADALNRHRIQPSLLTCEITESVAMEDTRATQETFRRLGELGVHVSIDDFGTGHSSLAYLSTLPVEELKIDRKFVMDLEHGAKAHMVIDAVIKLAHALDLKVVAEGVENERQEKILVDLGCDELQGFKFARPMRARQLLLLAIGDRGEAQFRHSLFGETRQGTRQDALSRAA